jgi:metal-dependent amidase/aminoacylase/carboxypeptidase family protein
MSSAAIYPPLVNASGMTRPGVCVLIGLANPASGITAPHHHPRFDIDDESLPVGAAVMAEAARRFLAAG